MLFIIFKIVGLIGGNSFFSCIKINNNVLQKYYYYILSVEHVKFLSIETFLFKKEYINFLFVVESDFGRNGIWNL